MLFAKRVEPKASKQLMGKRLQLRALSSDEQHEIERLAKSQKAEARLVQRARLIRQMLRDRDLSANAAGAMVGLSSASAAKWVNRFNEQGVAGLQDAARSGRPPAHDETVRSKLVNLALQKPRTLGEPFELWTLERLQRAFKEREGIHLSDSTIWEWMAAEGFHWKRQQSWFRDVEQHDSEFVQKRGP